VIAWHDAALDGTQHTKPVDVLDEGKACSGYVWYTNASYSWRVFWGGYSVKEGSACIDRGDARREVEHVMAGILDGTTSPPWKGSALRQELEQRLLKAR